MNKKHKQVQRYQRSLKHIKTREERKQLKELSRARRAEERYDKRRVDDDDDDAGFERMKSHRGKLRSASEVNERMEQVFAAQAGAHQREAIAVAVHRTRVDVDLDETIVSVDLPTSSDRRAFELAVGDRVALEERSGDDLRLAAVLERRSEIARPDPGDPRRRLVIAANVDAALIVTSASSPSFKPGLIDRFLIVLQRGGVRPIVCVNKSDLASAEERAAIEEQLATYRKLDVACHWTSAETSSGLDAVRADVAGRVVVLVGQSGVGKSSLLNALDPQHERATGHVRQTDGKGRHTTTSSCLHRLANGTSVIDTPGIRSLGQIHRFCS